MCIATMGTSDLARVADGRDLTAFSTSTSQPQSVDPPVKDICEYLEKVGRAPQMDHVKLQRVFRALQRWLESVSNCQSEMSDCGIVPALAKVFDNLLQKDYSKSDVLTSLLDLLFIVEDISVVPRGKEACGSYFISRLLTLVPTKLASVNLRRAAVETLCALITRCPANQQAVLDRKTDCLLLFNYLLPKCGDFQLQASIAETLYRLGKRDPQLINSIKDEDFKGALRSLHEMKQPDLLAEIRNLVVLLNESTGPFRSVYSFLSEWVIINGRNVTAAEEKWVDFGKTLFSFYALSGPVPNTAGSAEDCGARIFDILYVDIIDIRTSTAKRLEIVVHEQHSPQAPGKDQVPVAKQMHIQISFAEEDLSMMVQHVLSKIHPSRTKRKDENNSSGGSRGGGSARGLTICKSSEGIMVPLRVNKDDLQTSIAPKSDLPSASNVRSTSYSTMAVRQPFLRHENKTTEAKILPTKDSATVELGNAAEAKSTEHHSERSQIDEETILVLEADAPSPVMRCEPDRVTTVPPMKEFKRPADRTRSSCTGAKSQSEPQTLQKETPRVVVPDKDEAQSCSILDACRCRHTTLSPTRSATQDTPADSRKINALEGQKGGGEQKNGGDNVVKEQKMGSADNDVIAKEDVEADTVVNGVHKGSRNTPGKHPAFDSAGKKKVDSKYKEDHKARLVKATKALSGAKRSEPPGSDLLNEVTAMAEGPLAKVQSRMNSKRVQLADEIRNQDSIDPFSEVPNWHPKDGGRKEGYSTRKGDLVQKRTPADPQERVFVPEVHKEPLVAVTVTDHDQVSAGRVSKRNTDHFVITQDNIQENAPEVAFETQDGKLKRLKLTATTDPIESDSEKVEEKATISAPKNHRGAIPKVQQVGNRPHGKPRKEKVFTSSSKEILPIPNVDANFDNVYSFSQEVDVDKSKLPSESPRKAEAITSTLKKRKENLNLDTNIHDVHSFSPIEDVHDGKRPRGRPRKEKAVTSSVKEKKALENLATNIDKESSFSQPEAVPDQSHVQKAVEKKGMHMEKSRVDEAEKNAISPSLRSDYQNLSSGVVKNSVSKIQREVTEVKTVTSSTSGRGLLLDDPVISFGGEKETVSMPHRVSPKGKVLTSSTNMREPLGELGTNLDNVYSFTPSPDPLKLNSRCKIISTSPGQGEDRIRECSPTARTEKKDTPPVLKYDKQKSALCPSKQRERKPQTRAPKAKVTIPKSKGRKIARSIGKDFDKMVSFTNVEEKHALNSRIRAPEEERDVDIYYSTPESLWATRPRRTASHSPQTDNRRPSSYSPRSDEAADEAVFGDREWGVQRSPNDNLYQEHNAFVDFENDEEGGVAEFDSDASALKLKRGKAWKSRVQPRKAFKGPRVKYTAPSDVQESDDDVVWARDSTQQPCCSSPDLPLRMNLRRAAISENQDKDEDEGLGRAVKLVENMLEKFRRKVKSQTKEKTTQILDTALHNVESNADAYNTRIQQDLNDFVKVCKGKFENLEAQRKAQNQKERIWQAEVMHKFREHLQEYEDLLSKVKRTEDELKGIAEKQRAVHKRVFRELQDSVQGNLESADKKILAIKKAANRMHGLRDVLKSFNF